MSIHKDPRGNSKYFYCAFRLPNGKRAFRSTGTDNEAEARAICDRWSRQAKGVTDSPTIKNKDLAMESLIAFTQKLGKGGATEAEARKAVDDLMQACGESPLRHITARDFFTDWLGSKQLTSAKGTARRYKDIVDAFIKWLGKRADGLLSNVKPQDVQGFRDEQLSLGKANKTANLAVKTLRIALNRATRQGLILKNPADAVESLPEDSAERGTFTVEEIRKLLQVADTEWRGMVLVGLTCGLRLGDAARLTWASVDFERKVIRYRPQKKAAKARQRTVETPILPDFEAYLLGLRISSKAADAPLFPKLSKKKGTGRGGLSNTFTRLIGKAEIENETAREKKEEGIGRRVFRLSFHALRHTYISNMANSGVPKDVRMKLADHSSNVHDRYTHHELEAMRQFLVNMPRYGIGDK